MKQIKLFARRLALRILRKLVDLADDRLHAAEVKLRADLAAGCSIRENSRHVPAGQALGSAGETFLQWEARRSGVAPVSKKTARRRGMPASAFDLRYSR